MERPHGTVNTPDSNDDVEQLKAEIHDTQAELQETVAEIGERLSPSHLKEQAASTVREATVGRVEDMMNRAGDKIEHAADTTRRAADTATRGVRENPMPYALIGVGVAWLIASSQRNRTSMSGDYRRRSEYRNRDEYGSADYGSVAGYDSRTDFSTRGDYTTGEWSGASTRSSLSTEAEGAWNAASSVAQDTSRMAAMRLRDQRRRMESMLRDNPMVLAAAALAAGAVIGSALPTTEFENEYLGETKETMMESAREMAQNAAEKITGQEGQQGA